MHESDAMEFVESVLLGFLHRTFKQPIEVDTYVLYQPLIKEIGAYVKDKTGHWVKEKALDVVFLVEDMETQIACGRYEPESPEACVVAVLRLSKERMQKRVDTFKLEVDPKLMHDSFPLPVLPAKK